MWGGLNDDKVFIIEWTMLNINSGCYFRQENKYWVVLTHQTLKIVLLH